MKTGKSTSTGAKTKAKAKTKTNVKAKTAAKPQTKKRTKNPLYVVTNKGRDVEMVNTPWKSLINLWNQLIDALKGYTLIETLQKLLKQWVHELETLWQNAQTFLRLFNPVLANIGKARQKTNN